MEASSDSTYLECTTRKISSLQELKPGDHIAVMGTYMKGFITYKHHLLVVEVVNDKIVAIHKKIDVSVVEGTVDYRADEITVLDYDCPYTGQEVIARARERMDQGYKLLTSNCEHFVTEARTGKKQSIQVRQKVKEAAMAAGAAALFGVVAGAFYMATRKGKEKEDKEKEDKEKDNKEKEDKEKEDKEKEDKEKDDKEEEDKEEEDKKDSDSDVENDAAQ